MTRRSFLNTLAGAATAPLAAAAAAGASLPLGINTYCLRAMKWTDLQMLDYCAKLKLDGVFLQDSLDPEANAPAHWKVVRDKARELGLHLEATMGPSLPKTPAEFQASVEALRAGLTRAAGLGSPFLRTLHAGDRDHLPPGPVERSMETMIKVLRAVRTQAMDSGLKIIIENHKDLQAWEMVQVIEGAGREFVASLLDTCNPLSVMEDPMTTVEVLGPYAACLHIGDAVVYEARGGIAVQRVPLGEGTIDFKAIVAKVQKLAPQVYAYVKPITGRPPQIIPVWDAACWTRLPKARAYEFARYVALAKSGKPYDGHHVVEDIAGRPLPEAFAAAMQFQQREHMERSVNYAKQTLGLGRRWRS